MALPEDAAIKVVPPAMSRNRLLDRLFLSDLNRKCRALSDRLRRGRRDGDDETLRSEESYNSEATDAFLDIFVDCRDAMECGECHDLKVVYLENTEVDFVTFKQFMSSFREFRIFPLNEQSA